MLAATDIPGHIAIASGSGWSNDPMQRKISWRGYFGGASMPLSAQKRYWRDVALKRGFTRNATSNVKLNGDGVEFPACINIDLSVYDGGRKLRMVGSKKDCKIKGVRTWDGVPLFLVEGDELDTVVTYLPTHCVEMTAALPGNDEPAATPLQGHTASASLCTADCATSSGPASSAEGVAALVAAAKAKTVRMKKIFTDGTGACIVDDDSTLCPFGTLHKAKGKGYCVVGLKHVTVSCQSPRCGKKVRLEGDAIKEARRVLRAAAGVGRESAPAAEAPSDGPDEPDDSYAARKFAALLGDKLCLEAAPAKGGDMEGVWSCTETGVWQAGSGAAATALAGLRQQDLTFPRYRRNAQGMRVLAGLPPANYYGDVTRRDRMFRALAHNLPPSPTSWRTDSRRARASCSGRTGPSTAARASRRASARAS